MFLLALGEDYNILVMTRIREEAQHLPLRQAVGQALSATGTTVTSAGLVLAGTFGVLADGRLGQRRHAERADDRGRRGRAGAGRADGHVRRAGRCSCPSAVVLIGRWNWWPSRLGRKRPANRAGTPTEIPLRCTRYYLSWRAGRRRSREPWPGGAGGAPRRGAVVTVPQTMYEHLGADYFQDPYSVHERLRAQQPVSRVIMPGGMPAWLVTGYARDPGRPGRPAAAARARRAGAQTPARSSRSSTRTCSTATRPTTGGCAGWSARRSPRAGSSSSGRASRRSPPPWWTRCRPGARSTCWRRSPSRCRSR